MADEIYGSPADPDWVIDEDVARQPGQSVSIDIERHGIPAKTARKEVYNEDVARYSGHTFISAKRHGIPAKGANTQRYANQDVARYSGRSLTSEKRHGIPAKAMEPKIKGAKKRSVWGGGDTQFLLELWAERALDLRRAKRNGHIYHDIAAAMGDKFSAQEVHVKIGNLTQKYREEKKLMGPSGGSPSNWPYFADVHRIIGTNAANSAPVHQSFLFASIMLCGSFYTGLILV